jgi:hypothetical protein
VLVREEEDGIHNLQETREVNKAVVQAD